MKYTISTKKFDLSQNELNHIVKKHVAKILHFFPKDSIDLDQLDVLIRKNKHHNQIVGRPKLINSEYFDGEIKLILPKQVLVVKLFGEDLTKVINEGFAKLLKEIRTYKGKHYNATSEYKNHSTIRGHEDEYFSEAISM